MNLWIMNFGKVFLGVIVLAIGLFGGTCSNTLQALAAPQSDSVVSVEQTQYHYQSPADCNCGETLGMLSEAQTRLHQPAIPDISVASTYPIHNVTEYGTNNESLRLHAPPDSHPPNDVSITHWPIQLARSGI